VQDTVGGVIEWTADWYADDYYLRSPDRDPQGPATGRERTLRGLGRYDQSAWGRSGVLPDRYDYGTGFRCVRSVF